NVVKLQRTIGNQAVQRLIAQNKAPQEAAQQIDLVENRTARQKIETALKSKDPGDVKAIHKSEIAEASKNERFELIGILAYQGWVGPRDETLIEQIWESFGDKLPEYADEEIGLWNHCIEVGAELEDIRPVKALREQFKTDTREVVTEYLSGNRD